jgi:hypothetical protein
LRIRVSVGTLRFRVPPLPALKNPTLTRLEERLSSRPRAALLQDLARAEDLAGQLEAAQTYPEDWVYFRITGTHLDVGQPEMLKGEEVRGALSPLVERLSSLARHTLAEAGPCTDGPALCKRWSISRETLNRLRRRGLVGRRVLDARKRAKLVFRSEVVSRFEAAHLEELRRAAGFSRMGPEQERRILDRAAELRRTQSCTLNQAAAIVAKELGRSHEGVRQVLRRAEARAKWGQEPPVFGEAPALSHKQQELLYRAWRRGVDLGLMTRKMRRSRGAVRRAINLARARRLTELLTSSALETHAVPAFTSKDAWKAILSPAPARTGLGAPAAVDVLLFITRANKQGPPIGAEENARLLAYQFLRFEAAGLIGKLDRLQPAAGAIDKIETMLRWAARLKAELVRSQLKVMLEALHARLGRPVEQLPPGVLVRLLSSALAAVGDAVDAFDVGRGGRMAGAAGMAVDKVAIQWGKQLASVAAPKRATVMIPSGLALPDWTRSVAVWQEFLEPDPRVREGAAHVLADLDAFLKVRFGWDGSPPRTLSELAKERKINQVAVFRLEQRAMRESLRSARR